MTPRVRDLGSRLLEGSVRDATTGCLRWTGSLRTDEGYGSIKVNNRTQFAHRVAYALWVGPIPTGLVIDHVHARGCRYRDCIEPKHLEAVTQKENVARVIALKMNYCVSGHELTQENTYQSVDRRGYSIKHCRVCKVEANRRWRARAQADRRNVAMTLGRDGKPLPDDVMVPDRRTPGTGHEQQSR